MSKTKATKPKQQSLLCYLYEIFDILVILVNIFTVHVRTKRQAPVGDPGTPPPNPQPPPPVMVVQPSPQAPIPYASHQSYPVQVNPAPVPVAQPTYAAPPQQQVSPGQQQGLPPGSQAPGAGYPGSHGGYGGGHGGHGGYGGEFGGPFGYLCKSPPSMSNTITKIIKT